MECRLNRIEKIRATYFLDHAQLSWCGILFGFERHWLNWKDVVPLADVLLARGVDDPAVIDLAGITKDNASEVGALVKQLCELEGRNNESQIEPARLWLVLGLLWLFEHQKSFEDPLSFAEDLVDDVGNPADALSWLRFMPASVPYNALEHSSLTNYDRLMRKWQNYLFEWAPHYLRNYENILMPRSD